MTWTINYIPNWGRLIIWGSVAQNGPIVHQPCPTDWQIWHVQWMTFLYFSSCFQALNAWELQYSICKSPPSVLLCWRWMRAMGGQLKLKQTASAYCKWYGPHRAVKHQGSVQGQVVVVLGPPTIISLLASTYVTLWKGLSTSTLVCFVPDLQSFS